ncbi:MAG: hypothetical protein ACKOCH_02055, partial [Bacteroidota bacterium]
GFIREIILKSPATVPEKWKTSRCSKASFRVLEQPFTAPAPGNYHFVNVLKTVLFKKEVIVHLH